MDRRALLAGYARGQRDFAGATLQGQDLSGFALIGVCLVGADLTAARLCGADLTHADLRWVSAQGASLREATLRWADLSHADLAASDLVWADLREASLRAACLRRARLAGATLQAADLRDTDLGLADLWGADLRHCDLRGTDLSGADLHKAKLRDAISDSATDLRWTGMGPVGLPAKGRWQDEPFHARFRPPPTVGAGLPRPSQPPAHAAASQQDARWTDAYLQQCRLERRLFLQLYGRHPREDAYQAMVSARRELGLRVRQMRAAMANEQAQAIWSESRVCTGCGKPVHAGDPYRLRPQGRLACHNCDLGTPPSRDTGLYPAEPTVRLDREGGGRWLGRAKALLRQLLLRSC